MKKLIFTAVLLVALSSGLAQAGTLVYGVGRAVQTLDPARATDSVSLAVISQLYEPLVQLNSKDASPEAGLSDMWEVSPDGLEYTFTLKQGVQFHPVQGKRFPLKAQDVVFSLNRLRQQNTMLTLPSAYGQEHIGYPFGEMVRSITALSDTTVHIVLTEPVQEFLTLLAHPATGILSAEYAAQMLDNDTPGTLIEEPKGTGPFTYVRTSGGAVILNADADYYGEKALVDRLIFRTIPLEEARMNALTTGAIHILDAPMAATAEGSEENSNIASLTLRKAMIADNSTEQPLPRALMRKSVRGLRFTAFDTPQLAGVAVNFKK